MASTKVDGMGIHGINYDVGTQTGPYLSRAVLDPAETRREMLRIRTSGAPAAPLNAFLARLAAAPARPHRDDPARDLDLASYGVVRCYDDGHWEPRRLFRALAARNARA
jgi:hypothetical protein